MERRNGTKFQIASDLHLEIDDETPKARSLITPSADILILAGDIGRIHKYKQLKTFLTDVCQDFPIVIYVLGNHEYYNVNGIPSKSMDLLLRDLLTIKKEIPNLHVLHRCSMIIDNVMIAGCTLWSRPTIDVPNFIVRIPEMRTGRYTSCHIEDLNYIVNTIEEAKRKGLKLLVVTHHAPTYKVISDCKMIDKYASLYATNLDHLLTSDRVHTWVFGHTHYNVDFITEQGTRVISNQRGKPKDRIVDFLPNKVIWV